MKIKKMAKLHIFYFCNFKAHHFKQGHKANLCLKAYNPSHTAVLSAEGCHDFVFDNRTCHCCCCIMYNTHLARASSHFTTSPPQKTSFHFPLFPSLSAAGEDTCQVAGISGHLGLCKGKWLALWAETTPHVRWRTLSRTFLRAWCLLESFSRRNTRKLKRGTLRWGAKA